MLKGWWIFPSQFKAGRDRWSRLMPRYICLQCEQIKTSDKKTVYIQTGSLFERRRTPICRSNGLNLVDNQAWRSANDGKPDFQTFLNALNFNGQRKLIFLEIASPWVLLKENLCVLRWGSEEETAWTELGKKCLKICNIQTDIDRVNRRKKKWLLENSSELEWRRKLAYKTWSLMSKLYSCL